MLELTISNNDEGEDVIASLSFPASYEELLSAADVIYCFMAGIQFLFDHNLEFNHQSAWYSVGDVFGLSVILWDETLAPEDRAIEREVIATWRIETPIQNGDALLALVELPEAAALVTGNHRVLVSEA